MVTANTDIPDGAAPGQLVGYYNASAGSITVEGGTVAAGAHVILMWTGTAWQVLGASGGGGTVTPPGAPTITVDNAAETSLSVAYSGAGPQYRLRIDSGAWVSKSSAGTHTFTGLTAGTSHTIEAQQSTDGTTWSASASWTGSTASPPPTSGFVRFGAPANVTETGNATTGWGYNRPDDSVEWSLASVAGIPAGADGHFDIKFSALATYYAGLGLYPTAAIPEPHLSRPSDGRFVDTYGSVYDLNAPNGLGTKTTTAPAATDTIRLARAGGDTVITVIRANGTQIELSRRTETVTDPLFVHIFPGVGQGRTVIESVAGVGVTEWGDLDGTVAAVRMTIPSGTTGITESGNATTGWTYTSSNTTGNPALSVSTYGNAAGSNVILATIGGITAGTASARVAFSASTIGDSNRTWLWVDASGALQWDGGIYGGGAVSGVTGITGTLYLAARINTILWSLDGRYWREMASVFDGSSYNAARYVLTDAPTGSGTVTAKVAVRK